MSKQRKKQVPTCPNAVAHLPAGTLLNEMFGTSFEVMDATQGRRQTTKGLWLGRDQKEATLIIDVEGTDSKERGEDRLTFEHRAALFSLALADIVLVNMWYHDLGRYTASNYGLLKTVLGVNLELFQQQKDTPKTILLFVIRDYSGRVTPLDKLTQMIQEDIRVIWKETTKPEGLVDSSPDDFFIFKMVGLPSKYSDEWEHGVATLREMWLTSLRGNTYSRQIPSDGFAYYAKNVWETILHSSELDIPSQKEMLATFRCEELKNSSVADALPSLAIYLTEAREGTLQDKRLACMATIIGHALDSYDGHARRYQLSVFLKKREQLVKALQGELQKIFDAHLTHVRHRIASNATATLDTTFGINSDNPELLGGLPRLEAWGRFREISAQWRTEAIERFVEDAKGLSLVYPLHDGRPEKMDFDMTQSQQALTESLDAILLRMRERQQGAFTGVFANAASDLIGDFLEIKLTESDLSINGYWKSATTHLVETKKEITKSFGAAWLGLQTDEEACNLGVWEERVAGEVVKQTRHRLQRIGEWLQNYIFARFQLYFDQDEEGVPRQWQNFSSEKIREMYLLAKKEALVVVDIFDNVELDVAQLCPECPPLEKEAKAPILSGVKHQQVLSKACRQMQKACQEAQVIQTTGGRGAAIPWWMWGLLLAFGYNEIVALLCSPISLILVIIGLLVGMISYYSGNVQLPVQLSRHVVGMFATTLMSVLRSLSPESALPPTIPPSKREVKEEHPAGVARVESSS